MKMKIPKDTLPDKLSDLIILAMRDFELVENDSRYRVDMLAWHEPIIKASEEKCAVCFAGAVMAKSLNSDNTDSLYPNLFASVTRTKLMALNFIRIGRIFESVCCFYDNVDYGNILPDDYIDLEDTKNFRDEVPNGTLDLLSLGNIKEWKKHIATIIGILQAEGL